MNAAATILVVEDEPQIRRFVRTALEAEGWEVFEARTMRDGLAEAEAHPPDLVILDLGLPDGDGIEFLRKIRLRLQVPVIILSARTDEGEKVAALDAGADDYLTKPFSVAEMAARVRVGLRRARRVATAAVFAFGDVRIDFEARRVAKHGEVVHLTPIEYRLLSAMVANVGRVMTHRHLLREVWGPNHSEHTHYLRIYMAQLRQKLERDPARPRHLVTETGVGYRLLGDEDMIG